MLIPVYAHKPSEFEEECKKKGITYIKCDRPMASTMYSSFVMFLLSPDDYDLLIKVEKNKEQYSQ